MKFLFYVAKYYSIPIITPMVEFLQTTSHDYILMVSKKVDDRLKKEKKWTDIPRITTVKEGIKYNPDFCLSPGNYIDFRLPGIKVEIFHGIGIEKESHYKIRHFFDLYLTSGPVVTTRFLKLQEKYKYFLVKETGWPKMDYIMNYPSSGLKKKLNLPEDKKIILYAPTFSNKMQSGEALLPIIPEIIKEDEIWLMKFHEFMDKELIEKIKNRKKESIVILDTFDITPYLYCADVMISDTSSVVYEFMALDKPVITYRTIKREDKGINITSPLQLREALDRSLANPNEFSAVRKRHLEEVNPYLDGKICERVFEELIKANENNEFSGKKKPLNLIRKFKVLYHERFRKGYMR